jgi:hypothetical protein
MNDFKKFFEELTKIWNNGNVAQGLREHGVPAINLVIKYLPLGGTAGVAAAKALETLQVTKWINILATLIEFVSGQGNIMNFLNALKELVGDIFNTLKDVVAEVLQHPEKIGNAITSTVQTAANALQSAFDPAFAAQNAAYERDQAMKSEESTGAEEIINATIDDAKQTYQENTPKDIDEAIAYLGSVGFIPFRGIGGPPALGQDHQERSGDIQAMYSAYSSRIQSGERGGVSSDVNNQMNRANPQTLQNAYAVPYLLYLRTNWSSKPQWLSAVPALPSWSEQDFYAKATQPSMGGQTEFKTALQPFVTALNQATQNHQGAAYEEQQASIDAGKAIDQARWEKEAADSSERSAKAAERFEEARKILLRALNRPIPDKGNGGNEVYAQPFTTQDNIWYYRYADGKFTNGTAATNYIGSYSPYTPAELQAFLQAAIDSHKNDPKPGPAAPTATPAQGVAQGGGKPHSNLIIEPGRVELYGKHPFTHIKNIAKRHGREVQIDKLDPDFFEGGQSSRMSGSGKPEGTAIFKRVSEEAYKPDPAREVEGFKLFTSTPTLKFYENGPDVLVGIRGTKDFADAKADAAIPFGALENTQRFKADLATLQQVKAAHPDKTFYGAGHSLGAAILDLFISKGLIQSGKSFNGALQLGKEQSANERTYNSGDPLYMLSKPFLKQAPQVQTKAPSLLGRLSGAYNLFEQHKISGGAKRDREPTPEEIAEAEARADRRRRTDRADAHFGGIEQQLNELSQRMFRKRAEDLDDEENEQLDEAFQRLQGHHEDESDEEEEEDDGRTERIFGKKGRKGRRRARQFMQHLKFPARLAQYNATLKFQKRKYNKALRDQRADPDHDVPFDEDFTEFEYSDDGEEEPPKFEPGHYFKRGGSKPDASGGLGVVSPAAAIFLKAARPYLLSYEEAMDSALKYQGEINKYRDDTIEANKLPENTRSRLERKMPIIERAIPFFEQFYAGVKPHIPNLKRLLQISANLKPSTIKEVEDDVNKHRESVTGSPYVMSEQLAETAKLIELCDAVGNEIPLMKEHLQEIRAAIPAPLPYSTQLISVADLSNNPKIRSTGQIARANGGVMNPEEEL